MISTEAALIFATECQLATLERAKYLKSTSKSEIRRHQSIADKLVKACRDNNLKPSRTDVRLAALLKENS